MKNNTGQRKAYTLQDVFHNRKRALFILTFLINFIIVYIVTTPFLMGIPGYNAVGIILSCTNFATLGISALLAIGVIILFENKLYGWLTQTPLGNRMLSVITLGLGIATIAVMCGISYLWTPAEEITGNLQEDFYLGAIIPFDLMTLIFTLLTFHVWKMARKCPLSKKSWVHTGFIFAIISFIISCTPLQLFIQIMLIGATKGVDVLK